MKSILSVGMILMLVMMGYFTYIIPTHGAEVHNQIVLKYDRTVNNVRFFVPSIPLAIGLVPVDAAAPLSPGDLSICKMEIVPLAIQSFQGKEVGKLDGIMFRCGDNKYIFQSLAVVQERK
jgi:hypothetical protein